jgi:hypothetical protein
MALSMSNVLGFIFLLSLFAPFFMRITFHNLEGEMRERWEPPFREIDRPALFLGYDLDVSYLPNGKVGVAYFDRTEVHKPKFNLFNPDEVEIALAWTKAEIGLTEEYIRENKGR